MGKKTEFVTAPNGIKTRSPLIGMIFAGAAAAGVQPQENKRAEKQENKRSGGKK